MGEYLEFCENVATKEINTNTTIVVDLYKNYNRQKIYIITAEQDNKSVEIGRAYTPKEAQAQFRLANLLLKTDVKEKGEEEYYGR